MKNEVVHTISIKTILKVFGLFMLAYFLYYIRDILLLLFVAFIFSSIIDPLATSFQKKKVPRSLAVLIIYFAIAGIIFLLVSLLAPIITNDLPTFIDVVQASLISAESSHRVQQIINVLHQFGIQTNVATSINGAVDGSTALSDIFTTVSGIFGQLFNFVVILVMTFYLVVQEDPLKRIFHSIIPHNYLPYLSDIFTKIRDKLGAWMRGQMILSGIVGLLVFFGLSVFGVKHAVILSMLAAFMEFIPYAGPVLAAVPALLIAFTQGGFIKLFLVGIMYVVLQQLENHLLVPKVMQKAVGLNPIIIILSIMVGAKIAGPVGVILAIPVAAVVSILLQDLLNINKK